MKEGAGVVESGSSKKSSNSELLRFCWKRQQLGWKSAFGIHGRRCAIAVEAYGSLPVQEVGMR
jgi:hypothetical protein